MSETNNRWRDLALQFDNHRMQALWHLRALLDSPSQHRHAAAEFLCTTPIQGNVVAKEIAVQELTEKFKSDLLCLVRKYGDSVRLHGYSTFGNDKKAFDEIEQLLNAQLLKGGNSEPQRKDCQQDPEDSVGRR